MSQATPASISYTNSNLFSGYYLDERVDAIDAWDCDEEAQIVFEELQALWNAERDLVNSYNEDELLGSWIDPVCNALGYDSLSETTLPDGGGYNDRLLFDSAAQRREAASEKRDGRPEETYRLASALLEAKQWDADFTERFAEERSYRDASHQVKYYLERTPDELGWGILTNGRTWRLYGTKDYETSTYYEVDLVHLLESGSLEQFKYFYVFFRPAAFRGAVGETFLDRVWAESESAAQQLGEDLQDNVFTALSVLGTGFAETNSLSIDPGDTARLDELKEQSLVLLYRLMFVLYAESRDLIDPDDAHTTEYEENFSLDRLRREIVSEVGEAATERAFEREYSTYATGMWSRLEDLFGLIDKGNESLGIPPYNGGLFDEDTHDFLVENAVADRYLAEVIYRLSTTETPEGFVPAEYADLDTRHLGSIYEGLLEHEFRIAPEEYAAVSADGDQVWKSATEVCVADAVETVEQGELYVVNDDGERKATGAYYTPDYVVTYIVEETLGPLVQEIDADLRGEELDPGDREYFRRFWSQVTDLKVLDPAMGSGHFLTRATGYLTERVMSVVREQEIQSYDEDDLRRQIAKECIYGVDLNGMAVELAKLSMWLETLAADQPLAFLDHHLKTGNSLVGSDITDVLSDGDEREDGQLTFAQVFARTRKRALEHVMELMEDLLAIDNETLADVKSMEEIYQEIRADPLYRRLFAMANVHTAEHFGVEVPGDAYERMARAIEEEAEWAEIEAIEWFREVQELADEENFFHWELEFPEVFFGGEGTKMEGAGFDAVVGNPPYVNIVNIPDEQTTYLRSYRTAFRRFDLYVLFSELALGITQHHGYHSFIVPDKLLTESYAQKWRKEILERRYLQQVLDLRDARVFDDATNSPVVYVIQNVETDQGSTVSVFNDSLTEKTELSTVAFSRTVGYQIRIDWDSGTETVLNSIRKNTEPLSRVAYVSWGAQPGNADRFVFEEDQPDLDNTKPLIKGSDIYRYRVDYQGRYLWYNRDELHRPAFPELFENEKVCIRKVAGKQGLIASSDSEHYYTEDSVINLIRKSALVQVDDETLSARGIKIVDENRATDEEATSLVYDRDSIIYRDDLDLSTRISVKSILGIVNSSTIQYYYKMAVSGQLNVFPEHIRTLPLAYSSPLFNDIEAQVDSRLRDEERKSNLNLNLTDYFGNHDENGPTLAELGYQPPKGLGQSLLTRTEADASEFEKLRVTEARIERDGEDVTVLAVPYVKPAEEGEYETNSRGYATLDPLPAMHFLDLSDAQASLVEAFVPYAVEKADDFAGYRDNATATISPLDRLEALTLPVLSDVESGLRRYIETRERAEVLDEKTERTDDLIDEIVYELYELTDEEIEIIEESVNG